MNNYEEIVENICRNIKKQYGYVISKKSSKKYLISNPKDFYNTNEESINEIITSLKLDLRDLLLNDIYFDLKVEDLNFYNRVDFFQSLMAPIYYTDNRNIKVEFEDFKKIIKILDNLLIITSIKSLLPTFNGSNIRSHKFHLNFTKEILSINNYMYYQNQNLDKFWENINEDFQFINKNYKNEKDQLLKEGLINYLDHRKYELKNHQNKIEETRILNIIKKILHCDHWAEVSLYLPSYKSERELLSDSNIFNINNNPIYCIDLSKSNLLNMSNTTVTDHDLYCMMDLIRNVLNLTKPEGIDNIELSNVLISWREEFTEWNNIKIYLSGKIMSKKLVDKIINIFNKMIIEYNIYNRNKNMDYDWSKFAEVMWLDSELDGEKSEKKKVNKV